MPAFVYALPHFTSLQQEAAVARGLQSAFPEIDFSYQRGGSIIGNIVPIAGRSSDHDPNEIIMNPPPAELVRDVRTTFAGLLVEALAGPRGCAGCG